MTHFSTHRNLAQMALSALLLLGGSSIVEADDAGTPRRLLPDPDRSVPVLVGEIDAVLVIPAETSGVCPEPHLCVAGVGLGVSALFERRLPRSLGIGLGYDLWLLDGSSVWQTPTVQAFTLGLRYWFRHGEQLHPVIGAAAGFMLFGDTFEVATWGGLVDIEAGLEVELSTQVAFALTALARIYSLDGFVSEPDGVSRSAGGDVDLMIGLAIGLVVLEDTRRKE